MAFWNNGWLFYAFWAYRGRIVLMEDREMKASPLNFVAFRQFGNGLLLVLVAAVFAYLPVKNSHASEVALPIVKVAPIYPRRAMSRGIVGHCVVKYTVTNEGATKDIVPVDGECSPPGYFERASVKAAERFKYRPGAGERRGVTNRFDFEIAK